ncbi:MAG: hypothetical protein AAF530_09000 [Pseudomonadota bacterium]
MPHWIARPLSAAVISAFLLAPAAAIAEDFLPDDCRPQVQEQIEKLGVGSHVEKIGYYAKYAGGHHGDSILGLNAWVQLDNCRGDLVIELNRACELTEAYGHGDCGRFIPVTYND